MPIRRIDNCAFMIGKTGTCYYRANHCWKGMLILELARGGWVNVYHGNLELLGADDSKWFAKAQTIYHQLQKQDTTVTFGAIPGKGKPYGFKSHTSKGIICTVVNPSQQIASMVLPVENAVNPYILYADGGYKPVAEVNILTLGPEQLVVLGYGEFANEKYFMGTDDTINIPVAIDKIETSFNTTAKNIIEGKTSPVAGKNVRIIMQQFYKNGDPCRSWPGAPPDGKKVSEVIIIKVSQDGKEIPLHIEYDKMIWSGLSWGAGEVKYGAFDANKQLDIQCISKENDGLNLTADVYAVAYAS
jgi:hypothetical protein